MRTFNFFICFLLVPFWVLANNTNSHNDPSDEPEHILEDILHIHPDSAHFDKTIALLEGYVKQYIPAALYVKGVLILNGCYDNGKRNPREATIYFAKAAALNYVPAISALADSFLSGDGADESPKEAFHFYKIAADKNYGIAQFNLAVLYRDGIGVKQSYKQARKYFKLASKNPGLGDLCDDALKLHNEIKDNK
jgi:TPR repeat protein